MKDVRKHSDDTNWKRHHQPVLSYGPMQEALGHHNLSIEQIFVEDEMGILGGFLSIYAWTIFLRQKLVNGEWRLEHSPPIAHSDESSNELGTVTMRA
ncbi:hypothetical protein ETB97_002197 [Aspergillus alliaceus]|uniref:Uncharacterized protein n=1 Tax=Petromyces alliaceus TaxID=209559 RepID=A0A8H6E661_PETAA|nr:hypothetical protein ETB97_002197 [Aspergillus burnettii]